MKLKQSIFQRVSIIGIGLLGASVAQAAKQYLPGITVTVWARNPQTRKKCAEQPWCDTVESTPEAAVKNADIVIIATPVATIPALVEQVAPFLAPGATVTDVGSTKCWICQRCVTVTHPEAHFIGSHPMAGSEKAGMSYARGDLFQKATCFVTPLSLSEPEVVKRVVSFWERLGGRVSVVTPEEHDRITAHISHLPHALASCLCQYLGHQSPQWATFAGSGLRDATRIAAGDPSLWESIFFSNRDETLHAIQGFQRELAHFEAALKKHNATQLRTLLQNAKTYRDSL